MNKGTPDIRLEGSLLMTVTNSLTKM